VITFLKLLLCLGHVTKSAPVRFVNRLCRYFLLLNRQSAKAF